MGGDRVGVALDYAGGSAGAYVLGGFGYAVEGFGFVVEVGGGGVEIFGGFGVGVGGEFAACEPDYVSAVGADGEHDPVAEDVVGSVGFAADGGDSGRYGCLVVADGVGQSPPAVGGPSELPLFPVVGGDAPFGEVLAGLGGVG